MCSFFSILWYSNDTGGGGDYPQGKLAKFCYYRSERKVGNLKNPAIFWRPAGIYCLNMMVSETFFLEISGDFGTFFFHKNPFAWVAIEFFLGCQMVKIQPQNKNHLIVCFNEWTSSFVLLSDLLQEGFRKQLCFLNGQLSPRLTFLWKQTADHQHITLWSLSLTIFQEKLHVYLLKANRAKGGGVFDQFKERQSKRVYKLMNSCIWLSNSTIQKVGCGS